MVSGLNVSIADGSDRLDDSSLSEEVTQQLGLSEVTQQLGISRVTTC